MRKYTRMSIDEVMLNGHAELIRMAEDGCLDAAKTLMADAAILLQNGNALPEPLGSYIGEALYKATFSEDANAALHIKKARGKSWYAGVYKKHLICMEVQLAYLSVGRYTTTGTGSGAYADVAKRYNLNERNVRQTFEDRDSEWMVTRKTQDQLHESIAILKQRVRV